MSKDIDDEYFEFLLKKAADEYAREQGQKYLNELGNAEAAEHSENYKRNINKLLGRRYYKTKRRSTIIKLIASFFICICIGAPVVYSVNADFRLFCNKLLKDYGTHINITHYPDDEKYDFSNVDGIWEYFYIPDYIPELYDVSEIDADENKIIITYKNDSYILQFGQYRLDNSQFSLDKENSIVTETMINDIQGKLIENGDKKILGWSNSDFSFSIYTDDAEITVEELTKIAESIEIKNN